ncbi:MAG: AarF/ABC1/UbiB kinase family protein [Patescibacteria group bacterium]|nr:AarF/ABC1/UbiB kinase family protein [Patescibacteria group bacterium]
MKPSLRLASILQKFIPLIVLFAFYRKDPQSEEFQNIILRIRKTFQTLGPTYIKLGQMLSSRPDIVGVELAAELRNLLDTQPAVPFAEIEKILTDELHIPSKQVFIRINKKPLATASIGQVHKAVLKNGDVVAIKIQPKGIAKSIFKDLQTLKKATQLLDFILGKKGLKFSYAYREFATWITSELDFKIEGRTIDHFTVSMAQTEGIIIPQVYWQYTTSLVLVTTFIEGYTLNQLLKFMRTQRVSTLTQLHLSFAIDADILIHRLIHAFVKQLLVDRYFHADLHPANLIITPGNNIAFIDFGISGRLNREEHTQFLYTLLAIVDNDPKAIVKALTSLIISPLNPLQHGLLYEELASELYKLHSDLGDKSSFSSFIFRVFSLSSRFTISWTPGFILAAKTITQIDSITQQIGITDPMVSLIKPAVEKQMISIFTANISKERMYRTILDIIDSGKRVPLLLSELEQMVSLRNASGKKEVKI